VNVSSGDTPLQVGSTIGDHTLVRKLGEGAMGWVFEGVHSLIGKRVAIKVLKHAPDESQVAGKRLLEEARAVNVIHHRGIVDIYAAGLLADGRPYLVMELLVGRSLHEEVKRGKSGLPLALALHVLKGVLEALAAAHRAGVIHRDLKASNVFLVEQTDGLPLVKLVDFGVARRAGRSEVLTMPSMTVGSMGFMAPEHIAGKPVEQSDLYAVGCLAWLMLTGKPVFPYANLGVLVQQHMRVKPPAVSTIRKETTPELAMFVAWLLEKRVEARPFSAEVALAVLREAALAVEGVRTAPGAPSFLEMARGFDARFRAESERMAVTDVTAAFIPEEPRRPGPRAETTPPNAPLPSPPSFDSDAGTVIVEKVPARPPALVPRLKRRS
jgi:eukaryotic-like serine/threonine-protein kinase